MRAAAGITAGLLVCAINAHAAPSSSTYGTITAAAVAALDLALPLSNCHEYAGAIIEDAGRFTFTRPQRGTEGNFSIRIVLHPGEKLAAIYHTHPRCHSVPSDVYFSWNDVATADQLEVPSFIGVRFDGSIRRFDPSRADVYGEVSLGTLISKE